MAMGGSFLVFRQVVSEISKYQGVVAYSIDQLPDNRCERNKILQMIVDADREIHFAVERIVIRSRADIADFETIALVKSLQNHCLSTQEFRMQLKRSGELDSPVSDASRI